MTKLAHVERERAIGMLKANVTPLVVAKRSGAMFGRFDVLRIVSNKLGQRHTVHVQGVGVHLCAKLKFTRWPPCFVILSISPIQGVPPLEENI